MKLSFSFLLASLAVVRCEKETTGEKETIIGIDLGTTYSCVSYFKNGKPEIIANDFGSRTTPSWVAFTDAERLIGISAKNQAHSNPENTVFDAKRLIGHRFNDKEIAEDMKNYPFGLINKEGKPYIKVKAKGEDKVFSPEEISGMVLAKMKSTAEKFLGKEVKKAVVTVPAYFNDAQRAATKDAGTISGLNVVRILNEPTAAAIAYGLDNPQKGKDESLILVFDLGGGTFDVSLLTVDEGVFEVVGISGDTHLGGQDFDMNMINFLNDIIKKKHNIDVTKDKKLMGKLRKAVENAKIELSGENVMEAEIEIENINGKEFSYKIKRTEFEKINEELFKKTIKIVEKVLKTAKKTKGDVDEIVLVGGSTRIPKIRDLLKKFFNGKEPKKNINPDEAVAAGAAIQAGILSGDADTSELVVLDVAPLSLGIETQNGIMSILIERNTTIPTKKMQIFSTASDNQSAVSIRIFEGERSFVKDNHLLGNFQLSGIPLAPRGIPQIEVTFEIDANGILFVGAKDKGSGNKESVRITNDKGRLSPEEIDRMVKEAEKFSEEDKTQKERIEAHNDFEHYLTTLKDQLKDEKGFAKASEDDKKLLQKEIEEATTWLAENTEADKEAFADKKKDIEKVVKPIVEKIYKTTEGAEEDEEDHEEL